MIPIVALRVKQVQAVIHIVAIFFALAIVSTLGWASLSYFRDAQARSQRKAFYKVVIYSCLVLHCGGILYSPIASIGELLCGIILASVSLLIFWLSVLSHRSRRPSYAFVRTQPQTFVSTGPYRWVRHPFYLSFMLAATAGACIAGQPLLLLTVIVLFGCYYTAAKSEEASFVQTDFASAYESYRTTTGMFLPRLWSRRD